MPWALLVQQIKNCYNILQVCPFEGFIFCIEGHCRNKKTDRVGTYDKSDNYAP